MNASTVRAADATVTAPRPRSRLRARLWLAGLSTGGLAALAWASFASPLPRLVYNPSDSVAVGWYRVDPVGRHVDSMPVGSIVLARLPAGAAALAARRGYLPTRVPLLKSVGAVSPQFVCMADGIVRIDGVPVAIALRVDRMGRPLDAWHACRRLRPGELFLLGATNPASFDSRYFGPIPAINVIGTAHPLWLEARP
jgi:conjugative transfer signal peptidase TraF